ncbi:UDP-glycosyltransferase 82A1 isoform X1 [Jatropha curcas]|uniref:UDP-glycosyltransferase 82A1 isoform X1 n=1 Tax=Jatropha curcas TaxID=180498 RepID=UPI0005FB79A5|nr:UDP-glycosyltransferase 82A1 isoform X1 [Jatropha curcas]
MKLIKRSKILLLPYPAQGHVNPMMKLALALVNCGFEPVMITPEFIHRRIISSLDPKAKIVCMSVPDGLEKDVAIDFFAIEKVMENCMPIHLETLVRQIDEEDGRVACMIVDLLVSSAIEVGRRCGVPVAGFWPAMLATYQLIAGIPDMVRMGLISETGSPQHSGPVRFLPNQPLLSIEDLPWLIGNPTARKARFKFWTRAMNRSIDLQWLLVNSFPDPLDNNIYKINKPQFHNNFTAAGKPLVYQVVPLTNKHATNSKNPSFWEEDTTSLQWLDEQKPNSVVYISFGSWVSPIGESKVKSLALALEAMKLPFIWVLGLAWREGLPVEYTERISKQGKLVSWAPQVEILQHKAVGCYLTHCGWNSTMEAIQCQKRLLCYPVAGDQFLNCAYIVEKWKIGIKMNGFAQKDVEDGLRKVMDDNEMNKRLIRLYDRTMGKEANLKAMANLNNFIDDMMKMSNESHHVGL